MTTISASTAGGIVLTPASYSNQVYITAGVSISNSNSHGFAIFGTLAAFTIVNYGTVSGGSVSPIYLTSGGAVTNAGAGLISGGNIFIEGGPGTVVNDGRIAAGVLMDAGGSVTIAATASISSYAEAVFIAGATGTVVNDGTLAAASAYVSAAYLADGGSVTNAASAAISGGVAMARAAGTVINVGTITAQLGIGVNEDYGGSVINRPASIIDGHGSGVDFGRAPGRVVNEGLIEGATKNGVGLGSGGVVTNAQSGSITGGNYGVRTYYPGIFGGGNGTIVNFGWIAATNTSGIGVGLDESGSVTNATSGRIGGVASGVFITEAGGQVVNEGSITAAGSSGAGIDLKAVGSVINGASALISGGSVGVVLASGSTLTNAGTIIGNGGTAVDFSGTGNGRLVLVPGFSFAGGTVKAGISGSNGPSVVMELASAATPGTVTGLATQFIGFVQVTVDSGAQWVLPGPVSEAVINAGTLLQGVTLVAGVELDNQSGGLVEGYNSAAIYQSSGTTAVGPGVITAASVTYIAPNPPIIVTTIVNGGVVNDGRIVGAGPSGVGVALASGAPVTNAANGTITGVYGVRLYDGGSLTNAGTIVGTGGTAVAFGGTGDNRLVLEPGYTISGLVSGSTSATNTLELTSAAAAGTVTGLGTHFTIFGPIQFDAGGQWSIDGNTTGLAGVISGFAYGDTIELNGVTATGSSYAGGILTLNETGGFATLKLPGAFSTASFQIADVPGGTEVTLTAPCFRAGTRIRTLRGDVPVEALVVGDMVQGVRSGRVQEVVWIGYRRANALGHPRPENVWPVCIRACAISDRVPSRDVWLSPEHAVFLHGVLVPVRHLINGVSIVQAPCREVVYYHVELPMHDLMLSEGLLSESYLDMGNRADFENAGALVNAHPAFGADAAEHIWRQRACAPQVRGGAALETIRAALMRQGQRMGAQLLAERG